MISRRHFIQKASLLATGAAFGYSMVGCESSGFVIPCLGPAAAPIPVPGMTYIKASEIGCALDCDLKSGRNKYTGGAATDDAPRINAAMAVATAENPITLIIDGSALVSGLFLPAPGNWSIAGLGCGTGFFLKSGSNNDAIHNGPANAAVPSDPGPPAPARGANVSLSNFTVNGNQGNGHDGNSTSGSALGSSLARYIGINLMSLENILIKNVVLVNTSSYHIRLSNVGNALVSGCVIRGAGLGTDGVHIDGPSNDITISGCDIACGDDSVALNCPEGYSGDISSVTVSNCQFHSLSLMRLYTTTGSPQRFTIRSVTVSNCWGTLTEAAFLIGLAPGSLPNATSLTITDCTLTAPTVLALAENFGTIVVRNTTFTPSSSNVIWVAPQSTQVCAFLRPSPLYGSVPVVGSNLFLENCNISNRGHAQIPGLVLDNDSVIENLVFTGFAAQDAIWLPELLYIRSGSIGQLVLESLSPENMSGLVSEGGFSSIGLVSGQGVLATGWEFPDAVMADEVPYISASTGLPAIKVNGVVQTYTP